MIWPTPSGGDIHIDLGRLAHGRIQVAGALLCEAGQHPEEQAATTTIPARPQAQARSRAPRLRESCWQIERARPAKERAKGQDRADGEQAKGGQPRGVVDQIAVAGIQPPTSASMSTSAVGTSPRSPPSPEREAANCQIKTVLKKIALQRTRAQGSRGPTTTRSCGCSNQWCVDPET